MNVSAVLVTRGDIDLAPVIDSLPMDDIVVWDNSKREDLKCYGRFAGIRDAKHDLVYVQDDDTIVPASRLIDRWDGGVVANRPPGETYKWLGVGTVFHRDSVNVFDRYLAKHPFDADFLRGCDVVFAELNDYRPVWVGYTELPWATADNRMYKQPDHYTVRNLLIDRSRALL